MGYVTTPDGRQMLVPDDFGGSSSYGGLGAPAGAGAPPLAPGMPDANGAIAMPTPAPDAPPPMPTPPPAPVPSVTGGQIAPPSLDPSTPIAQPGAGAPAPNHPDFVQPLPPQMQPPPEVTPQQQHAQVVAAQKQAAYAASPQGQLDQAHTKQDAADAASLDAIRQQRDVEVAKAGDVNAATTENQKRQQKLDADQAAWQALSDKTRGEKQAYVDASLKDVDNFKIDQGKAWHDEGTAKQIGWGIAMVLSGLGGALSGKGGEPNPVVTMLQQKAAESIRLQMDQRDQLKDKANRAEHALDRYDVFSKDKQAQFELLSARSDKLLAQQLTQAATKYAAPEAQAHAQAAVGQLLQSSAEHAQKAAEFATTSDLQKKQLAVSQAGNSIAAGHLALARDQFAWTKDKDQQSLDLEAAKLVAKGDPESAKMLREQGIGGLTVDGKAPEQGGQLIVAPTKEEAVKLREQKAGVDTANRLINDITRGIRKNGGASEFLKTPEWQRIEANKESLLFALHGAYGVEGFRPGVLEQMEKALGGVDPASFLRDASPGLLAARDALNSHFTDKLRVADPRFKGEYKPTDTSEPAEPVEQPGEADLKSVLRKPTYDQMIRDFGIAPDAAAVNRNLPLLALDKAGYILPSQRQIMDAWASGLTSDDPTSRKRASEFLAKIADKAETPEISAYAQQLLTNNIGASLPETPETPGGSTSTSTAREPVPLYPRQPVPTVNKPKAVTR